MELDLTNQEPPSEDFIDVFDTRLGYSNAKCFCGRTHFDGRNNYGTGWKMELKSLMAKRDFAPGSYIEHDCPIGTYEILGITFVYQCPCNGGRNLENFIIRHAGQIKCYLKLRYKRFREKLKSESDAINMDI